MPYNKIVDFIENLFPRRRKKPMIDRFTPILCFNRDMSVFNYFFLATSSSSNKELGPYRAYAAPQVASPGLVIKYGGWGLSAGSLKSKD